MQFCERIFRNDRDMLLEREYCSKHFCIKCLNYKTHEYQAMMKAECMWFCLDCKPKIEKNIINEKVIEERCEFYLATINDRLDSIERQLQTKCNADAVKVIVHEALGTIEGNAPKRGSPTQGTENNRDVIQETVKELKDREERQDNFIICNAPEPNTNLKEVRICDDTELVKNLCNGVCEIDVDTQNDIADVIRLGRKPEGEGKPRPLKVLMKNNEKKTQLFKNLWKLRDADAKFNCLRIQNDLTKKEREDEKKLVDAAKAKEASTGGNSRYRVRGPPWARRVVKMRATPGEAGAE